MKSIIKYLIILPMLLINFSCEDATTESTVYNGDVIGSWKLTGLTGTYLYTVNLPDGNESGVTWASDTTFGMKARWDMADAIFTGANAPFTEYGNQWLLELQEGDIIPGVSQTTTLDLSLLQGTGVGLIGVFEDAPGAGEYATYYFKGVYPSVSYNYTNCATGSAFPTMTDQGIYKWDQTASTDNFEIKRDPSILGTQVLPPFDDGTIAFTDTTLNTLNIKFIDRDSHSSSEIGYGLIPEYVWDEGKHPNLTSQDPKVNSGGDRTYAAPFTTAPIGPSPDGYGDMFYASSVGATSMGAGPAYIYNPALAFWGNYMTFNAFNFNAEVGAKLDPTQTDSFIGDVDGNGTVEAADLVAYMVGVIQQGLGSTTTTPFGVPYANIIDADSLAVYGATGGVGGTGNGLLKNDSDHDLLGTDLNAGGRMKYNILPHDCAIPADVTIDFNATLERCTTDNCAGEDPPYHVTPSWD